MQVQRSLSAPAPSNTRCDVQPKAAPAAPAVSRALALVLSATESKENDDNTEYPDTGRTDYAEDKRTAGKTEICGWNITCWIVMCRLWTRNKTDENVQIK